MLSEGNVIERAGKWYARISYAAGARKPFALPHAKSREEAAERAAFMLAICTDVRGMKDPNTGATLLGLLVRAAEAPDASALPAIRAVVDRLTSGTTRAGRAKVTIGSTFGEVANAWTSGELAKRFPDHVKAKRTADDDAQRLRTHVLPLVGAVPMRAFSIDHAERVMAALDPELSAATRRQVAQVINRVCAIAVYPMRLMERTPLPKGWLPKVGPQPKQAQPYPVELDRFCACSSEPLALRLFVGFLAREGMRHDEAESLTWADVDLAHGLVKLDENKTDDPRGWDLAPSVARALRVWHEMKGKPGRGELVFVDDDGEPLRLRADDYRAALLRAGVDRAELFEEARAKDGTLIRNVTAFHALRGLFVTSAFMTKWTEREVMRRTGHTTSTMLSRYNDVAATLVGAKMAPLGELDQLLGWTSPNMVPRRKTMVPPVEGGGSTARKRRANSRSPRVKRARAVLKSAAARRVGSTPTGATTPQNQGAIGDASETPQTSSVPCSVPSSIEGDPVEAALSLVIVEATRAGRWDVVGQLARELEARRVASAGNVVSIASKVRRG